MKFFTIIMLCILLAPITYGQAQPGTKDPVNWRKLTPFLIDFDGWKAMAEGKGQTMTMGTYKMTQVERNYKKGDKTLEVQIIDGAAVQMAYMGFKTMMNYEIDSSEKLIKKVS